MSQPRRYIGKAIIHPTNTDNLYDVKAVEDANGNWVAWEDYEKLQAEVKMWKDITIDAGVACNERARENQDLENQIERLKAEVEKLRFASRCDIPKLYSQINFVDKKWEVVRIGAKDDVEHLVNCVRVTLTLVETK